MDPLFSFSNLSVGISIVGGAQMKVATCRKSEFFPLLFGQED